MIDDLGMLGTDYLYVGLDSSPSENPGVLNQRSKVETPVYSNVACLFASGNFWKYLLSLGFSHFLKHTV